MIFHNSIKKDIFVTFATFALCATTANSAETRYKDRMFTVEKTKDIAFAADVPHLNSPHPLMDMIYSSTGEKHLLQAYLLEIEKTARRWYIDS